MFAYAVMTLSENPYETGAYVSNFYATYDEALREACEDVEYMFGDKYPIGKVAESIRMIRHGDYVTKINVVYDESEINCTIFSPNDLPIYI